MNKSLTVKAIKISRLINKMEKAQNLLNDIRDQLFSTLAQHAEKTVSTKKKKKKRSR